MKYLIFILIFSLSSYFGFSQNQEVPVDLYANTFEFTQGKKANVNAIAIIKDMSPTHLVVEKFIDSLTRKTIRRSHIAWALEYRGETYFNMMYSYDAPNAQVFAKFDIVGKYSAIFINKDTPNAVKNGRPNYGNYGLGLTGALMAQSPTWNKNWKDKDGLQVKILLIDLTKPDGFFSYSNLLTRNQVRGLLGDTEPTGSVREIPFEEVVKLIEAYNKN
ncbi:MAG TPA: hypothetical protein VGB63_10405 [Pedobacter sp.]|jgi:hypothetical protein